jgi:hypothetical protein
MSKSFWTNESEVKRACVNEGWDGNGGMATRDTCRIAAESLALELDQHNIPGALVVPDDVGGLEFNWNGYEFGQNRVLIEVKGRRRYGATFYLLVKRRKELRPVYSGMFENVIDLMDKLLEVA